MSKQETVLDWQVLEANADWPPPTGFSSSRRSKARRLPHRWQRWTLAVLLAILLPMLVAGYRVVRRADEEMTRVENEVRAAVAADTWIDQHKRDAVKTAGLAHPDPEIAEAPGLEARRVQVNGDYAMVEVWTMASDDVWLPAPYRQTRFYQETELGWLAVVPPERFWQPRATLQAGRFTFVYGPRDAEAVLAAAQKVEAVDANLRMELGLPATNELLRVEIVGELLHSLDLVDLARPSDGVALYAP
jgi:hypothetical protein